MSLVTSNLPSEEHFKSLSKAMSLVLLEECYDLAIADDAPFSRKLDLLKMTVKLGDLEPKQNMAITGSGFSIKIVFGAEAEVTESGLTIDHEDAEVSVENLPPPYTFFCASPVTDHLSTLYFEPLELLPAVTP